MKIKYIDYGAETRPERSYPTDAGIDVHIQEDVTIDAHETRRLKLGFGLEIPDTYAGFVILRSSYANLGLQCGMSAIDSSYKGEISLIVTNSNSEPVHLKYNERVASLILLPVVLFDFVDDIPTRGDKGFGSTGKG